MKIGFEEKLVSGFDLDLSSLTGFGFAKMSDLHTTVSQYQKCGIRVSVFGLPTLIIGYLCTIRKVGLKCQTSTLCK